MVLKDFLNSKEKRIADMARDFGVVHCIVRRWCNGETIPTAENMQKIFEYTDGLVTANDFYNIKEG